MRVRFTTAHGERLRLDAPELSGLRAALERRGVMVAAGDGPPDGGLAMVGAPSQRLGAEAVRAWRGWVRRGGRLLVLAVAGGDGASLESDAGMLLPALELAPHTLGGDEGAAIDVPGVGEVRWRGTTWQLRGRAILEPAPAGGLGALWPQGRGWFRFQRRIDVLDVWEVPGGLSAVHVEGQTVHAEGYLMAHLAVGGGAIVGLGDGAALADAALTEVAHRALLSTVLEAWLPALEGTVCAALLAGRDAPVPPVPLQGLAGTVAAALEGEGLALATDAVGAYRPVLPALRALGEHGLARWTDRIRLTETGRAHRDVVRQVLSLRDALRAADRG